LFTTMQSELLTATCMEERLHTFDELAQACRTNMHVRKIFFEQGETMYKLMIDQLRYYACVRPQPYSSAPADYCREDELEYVTVIIECLCSIVSCSECLSERLVLFEFARPYSVSDVVALLCNTCYQSVPSVRAPEYTDTEISRKKRSVNHAVVSLLVQIEGLAEHASLEGVGGPYSVILFVEELLLSDNFIESKAQAMFSDLLDFAMGRNNSPLPIHQVLKIYDHCRLIYLLMSKSVDVRRYIADHNYEELKYFLMGPNFLINLHGTHVFFAERINELIREIQRFTAAT